MVFSDGRPKGVKVILEERGINTRGMKLVDMTKALSQHSDFRDNLSFSAETGSWMYLFA